jgi:Transglycosylase-like domain
MRRALAVALTSLAAPATALAANPYKATDLKPSPVLDKALIAHEHAKRARKADRKQADAPIAIPGYLAAIAACESGGNPQAIGGGGQYRGMFQMTYSSWAAAGGAGDPAAASVAEQVKRAEILYAQSGPGQWPVCGA